MWNIKAYLLKRKRKQQQAAQSMLRSLCSMKELPRDVYGKVDELLKQGASFTRKNAQGVCPLDMAFQQEHVDVIGLFIGRDGNIDAFPYFLAENTPKYAHYMKVDWHEQSLPPKIQKIKDLQSLLMENMTPLAVEKAHLLAQKAGQGEKFEKGLVLYQEMRQKNADKIKWQCFYHPEQVASQHVAPPEQITTDEFLGFFEFPFTKKHRDISSLVRLKIMRLFHLPIHYEKELYTAVMKNHPHTFDFLEEYGAPYFVEQKAFDIAKKRNMEDTFTARWILVTDEVCDLRYGRKIDFIRSCERLREKILKERLGKLKKKIPLPLAKNVHPKPLKEELKQATNENKQAGVLPSGPHEKPSMIPSKEQTVR